jgi:nucleoside-diphosphate-sugar epimerase
MYTKLLVTGASGFVGKAVCNEALKKGFKVRGSLRNYHSHNSPIESVMIPEINSRTDWTSALKKVDVLVHLAARVHVMRETEINPIVLFREINVNGTLNLAYQAVNAGCKRFIFLSSIGVNGHNTQLGHPFSEVDKVAPHNAYALSKWEAEKGLIRIAEETGLQVVIIRPPLVYGYNAPGNFDFLKRAVYRGWPLPFGALNNQRSFVALDNLVDFIITCITHTNAANNSFLVSDGQDLSTAELVRGMAQAASVPLRLLPVPLWVLKAGASMLGKGDVFQRLCGNLQIDISKTRDFLNWEPPVSVEEGLKRAMAI